MAEEWLEGVNRKMEDNKDNTIKGGELKMDIKKIIMWIITALLAIAVIYVVFFRGAGGGTGGAISSTAQAVQSSGGMVGGC